MKNQTVMWTALPNGVEGAPGAEGAHLRLSVLVSPRLQTNEGMPRPTLSQFPDFLNWPAAIAQAQFSVQFGTGQTVAAQRVSVPPYPSPEDLWQSIFDANTYVKPYEFLDLSKRLIRSFPIRNVASRLKETYQQVAVESPVQMPHLTPESLKLQGVRNLFQDIALTPQRNTEISQQMTTRMRTAPLKVVQNPSYDAPTSQRAVLRRAAAPPTISPLPAVAPATSDFHQFETFHRPPAVAQMPQLRAQDLVASIDFHQILASLEQYPQLVRRLGLVIDLEIPFTAELLGASDVRVVAQWTPELGATTNRTPRTHCMLIKQAFRARNRPGDTDLRDGMLRLDDDERFEIDQFDVDGAAIKTMEVARQVMFRPAVQLKPLALRRVGGARVPPGTVAEARAVAKPEPEPEETALPTLRSAGIWVARVNRAVTLANSLQRAASLNQLMLTSTRPDDEISFYAEDLVRGYRVDAWDAEADKWYSLCQRVGTYRFTESGQTLILADEGWVASAAAESPDASADLRLHEVLFRWEGWSLSAPRPGKAVESEGGQTLSQTPFGVDISFLPSAGSLPRLRFGNEYRLRARGVDLAGNGLALEQADDSAASEPITYLRQEPVSAPVLIPRGILGSPGESLERLVLRSFNDSPAKDAIRINDLSQRHTAAPKTSQLMAETHGMFDSDDDGMEGDAATYELIVSRDQSLAEFYNVDQIALPYLPDPLAVGALIRFKLLYGQGAAEQVLRIPFDGDWPNEQPFRLVMHEDPAGQTQLRFDTASRILYVPMAKAERAEILMSTYTKADLLSRMGMWRLTMEGVVAPALRAANLPQAEKQQLFRQLHDVRQMPRVISRAGLNTAQMRKVAELKQEAEKGTHWMLTPHRKIVLVHAVQQPLIIPEWQGLAAAKAIGDTFATLMDSMPISGKSTAKVDILAEWDEPIDALEEPRPGQLVGKASVGELKIEPQTTTLRIARRHEFGDTRYRRVTYTALATSRFRDYFNPDDVNSGALDLTRTSAPVAVDVLSSARPALPKVLYVIPTFGWQRSQKATAVASTRSGGGLRVYLERPWYSSGDGELLGVIIPQSSPRRVLTMRGPAVDAETLKRHVTQWGQDPLWQAAAVTTAAPPLEAFNLATATESDLSLEELPGTMVSVAGHEVGYDEDRQLWYCDIEIDPGNAYYPFVRLALARYQPMSVKGASGDVKLSRVVLADFVQLTPERTATVVPDRAENTKLQVTVAGITYAGSAARQGGSEVEVSIEKQLPNAEGVMGWVPASDEVFSLPRQKRLGRGGSAWSGTVELPTARGTQSYRLVIREYETYIADMPSTGTGLRTMAMTHLARHTERRLVYADSFEV